MKDGQSRKNVFFVNDPDIDEARPDDIIFCPRCGGTHILTAEYLGNIWSALGYRCGDPYLVNQEV